MLTWDQVKEDLNLTEEEKEMVRIEEEIIQAVVAARAEQKLSQAQLAEKCNMKQSVIARLESQKHFPRIDTLLKVLLPLGYTIKIVPKKNA